MLMIIEDCTLLGEGGGRDAAMQTMQWQLGLLTSCLARMLQKRRQGRV
jgi:hypothetical protein